jgi:hypothetical protein
MQHKQTFVRLLKSVVLGWLVPLALVLVLVMISANTARDSPSARSRTRSMPH